MINLPKLSEAIVVEGRYDKSAICNVVNTIVVATDGFCISNQPSQLEYIKTLAQTCGIIILTDSDVAGFQIRRFLYSVIPPEQIKHAYIPLIPGKERRKSAHSKSGMLGVEAMSSSILLSALKSAGATFLKPQSSPSPCPLIAALDLFELGLSGSPGSKQTRKRLLAALNLPPYISNKGLLRVLNTRKLGRQNILELIS